MLANPEEGGQEDGLTQEGDDGVRGEPQQGRDIQAQGGIRIPCVTVSGLTEDQYQPKEEFDNTNIMKLISDWDAMAGGVGGCSEQSVERVGGGGGS